MLYSVFSSTLSFPAELKGSFDCVELAGSLLFWDRRLFSFSSLNVFFCDDFVGSLSRPSSTLLAARRRDSFRHPK